MSLRLRHVSLGLRHVSLGGVYNTTDIVALASLRISEAPADTYFLDLQCLGLCIIVCNSKYLCNFPSIELKHIKVLAGYKIYGL